MPGAGKNSKNFSRRQKIENKFSISAVLRLLLSASMTTILLRKTSRNSQRKEAFAKAKATITSMNKEKFQKAFDTISFSPDFQERTLDLLRESPAKQAGKSRKHGRVWKAAVVMALIAVIGTSAFAASSLLSPSEIAASMFGTPTVAALFEGEDSVLIEESQPLGDYILTLHGVVSGSTVDMPWRDPSIQIKPEATYIILSAQRKDGTAVSLHDFVESHNITPVVDSYEPGNVWDENGINQEIVPVNKYSVKWRESGTVVDGVFYWLIDATKLEIFADHTVKLAVFHARDSEGHYLQIFEDILVMDEDGTVSFREDFTLPHAMFTLPLDESRADPEAAQTLLEQYKKYAFHEDGE